MRPLFLLPALLLPLAACMQTSPAPVPVSDLSQCGGNALLALVGQPVTALPGNGGWGTLRVIKPGMMVTEDYSASRLNVQVDGAGTILALSCG